MNLKERFDLITRNLQEVIGEEELKEKLNSKKEFVVYWGTMPTGSISIAYFFPMLKIADLLKAGCRVKILNADLHAALDSVPWEELEKRFAYYQEAIETILKTLGVDLKKLEFVKGSELQLNNKYFEDLLKMSTFSNIHDAVKASSEVVKASDNPKLSGAIYPLMQALDEEYLGVDAQLGGNDQRKIMVFAREYLPKIGYERRIELLNPLIRGLVGEKMSSSQRNTKIDLMDDEESVKKRINGADCVAGDPNNGIMALLKYFIMIIKGDKGEKLVIKRPEKFGGNIEYSNYESIEKDFVSKKLHPMDLKNGVAGEINNLLVAIRKNKKLKKLHEMAYPKA
ncbi:MAG: tyrosine--tRNA ligase [archaeon]|nr:tyrosine--tRNA ligase [archaeon]MCR4323530.1 tyrosine--tRNA ligase [Nanoarchaeota archaeon]